MGGTGGWVCYRQEADVGSMISFVTIPFLQSVAACLLAVGGVTTHPCLQQAIEDVLIGNDTCEPAASGAQSKEQRTQSCLRLVYAHVCKLLVSCPVPMLLSDPSPSRVVCSLPAYLLFRDSASAAQCPSVAGLENLATLLQQAIVSFSPLPHPKGISLLPTNPTGPPHIPVLHPFMCPHQTYFTGEKRTKALLQCSFVVAVPGTE